MRRLSQAACVLVNADTISIERHVQTAVTSKSPQNRRSKPLHVYRDIKELVWPRRKLFALGLLLTFVNRAAGLVTPWASRYLIDDVVGKHNQALLGPLVAAVGGAVVISGRHFLHSGTGLKCVGSEVDSRDADSCATAHRTPAGPLLRPEQNRCAGIPNYVRCRRREEPVGYRPGGTDRWNIHRRYRVFLLIRINAVLTVFAVLFLGLFATIMRSAFQKVRPMFRERGAINAEVTGRLTESLGGVRVVKGFHAEEREARVFEAGALRLFDNVRKTLLAQSTTPHLRRPF